ncbi:uncharacterized protein LOC143361301 [Halictus rubicundus]|uniref:uncharacterized protein LOC143361301 n=1 Tax=Halictus rubicundus TaxID=77578 RepID=UPI0040374B45
MASNTPSFPRMLKMLRENSNIKDKREALTYIRSNSKRLEQTKAIKEEQYKELYKLVIDVFASGNNDIQNEAYETLNVIIQDFRDHSLNLFETMSQISQKTRLKILKLLEVVEDNAISTVAYDAHTLNFFNNCMCTIQTNTMPWIAPGVCTDNIQALSEAESRQLSDDQRLEEETINYCMILLRRLYKVAAATSDPKVQRFHALLLDKIMLLAYMGHKRQRSHALKLLEQSLATDITSYIRTKLPEAWAQYKSSLQSTYCKRMLLLVSTCELDWATQWNISIQFLGVDLHRGAGLINNLLSVEEKAFKSVDTVIRRQAFLSWKLLVDNFALDPQELATARRIKLLCVPLNAKNSKSELIALTKLEVWWHVIIKLYKDISKFVNPVITQFLNFCFGPLGDTPLMSSKFEIVASPGKRFYKTKIIAVDALCQLLVTKQENSAVFSPILEERLPHSLSDSIFQESYKCFIHSVGEAWLVLSQLTDAEMKNRHQLGKTLWSSLVNYIQESKAQVKEIIYKDLLLVITELTICASDKPMIRNLILDTVLPEIIAFNKNFDFEDDVLLAMILKLVQIPLLNDATKTHYDILKHLFSQTIKSETKNEYYAHALKCLKEIYEKLSTLLSAEQKNETVVFELWRILAEVLTKYMDDLQEINEGNAAEHNLKTVESIVIFPFMYISLEDHKQAQELIKVWKNLYKQFEMRADLIETVKSNEILLSIANAMQCCIVKNEKSCSLITKCLDILLSTVNYKFLLANVEVPSIIHLIIELITCSLSNTNIAECEASLKALSAVLITIYGHNPQKVISYLQVCRPAVELILSSKIDLINKEVINTWETIVSIFKGLNKLVDYDLILSYKKAIILALSHRNLDVQNQAVSLFDLTNVLSGNAKSIFQEIEIETGKDKISRRRDATKRSDVVEKSQNQIKMVGSFLNRRSCSPKSIVKESSKTDKKILPDSNSEDYVYIKTDLKFDVSRLTDHQKESLKRKRDDIPALYNDLSQSSSQDTQNLQEWFDRKNEVLAKKDNISMKNAINDEANKENKLKMIESEIIDKTTIQNDGMSVEHVGQNMKDVLEKNENLSVTVTVAERCENSAEGDTNKGSDQRLSPSILDSGKRRNRHSTIMTPSISQTVEETNSQPEQSDTTMVRERKLRTKGIHNKSKIGNKHRLSSDSKSKFLETERRGIKRKATSDSDSESTTQRRRTKIKTMAVNYDTPTDSDSSKTTEVDNIEAIIEDGSLSQRTKNEISRLRINMVFDSPLSNSRRSKGHEDSVKEVTGKKQSPDNKTSKLKAGDIKTGDSLKKNQKSNDKELNKAQYVRKGGRLIKSKSNTDKNNELAKSEDNDAKITVENKGGERGVEKKLEEEEAEEDESKEEECKEENTEKENKQGENKEKKNKEDIKEGEEKEEETVQIDMSKTAVEDIESEVPDANSIVNTPKIVEPKDDESNTEVESRNVAVGESVVRTEDSKLVEHQTQTEDDTEDIIENSQDVSELQKKCTEKQCFIKINKIGEAWQSPKLQGTPGEDEEMGNTVASTCDDDNNEVPKGNVKGSEVSVEVDSDKPKISTPTADNNLCDNGKYVIVEVQKANEGSSVKSIVGFSSPKSLTKRQLKFKAYSAQGRAAHMLGLVTKQAKMESETYTVTIDDEAATKKLKIKDTESETGKKEKNPTLKEPDKVTATCSSRQEKIFNNMRSSDYCPSPSMKLFSNLKNDGEKIFSKVDKSVDSVSIQTDVQVEKVNEGTSTETEELPILEWSSANPPSLTASPSVSILKRQRQSIPEPDPECTTPNKRKRVSFADPPVSKEMGYEIATTESPHKFSKSISRLLSRKDSPIRAKHIKPRLIHVESEKMDCDEETDVTNASELDLQCERENELLTKIAEDLEYSENFAIDTDHGQTSCVPVENELIDEHPVEDNVRNKIKIHNLNVEFEITQNTTFSARAETKDNIETSTMKRSDNATKNNTEAPAADTNDDLFNGEETKHDNVDATDSNANGDANDRQNLSMQNRSEDSLNYDIANDSVIQSSCKGHSNADSLEDTVDVQNISSLNSTTNSDEIFCGKLMRTSTKAVDSAEEQDTLPVTDSVFGSLPLSNDSQNVTQFDAEMSDPELLDSTQPIYPLLTSSSESIQSIVEKLTNPLWVQHLSSYLRSRNLETIGDLARLSEREVNRMPVKGNSKVELVRSVLKCYERTHVAKETNNAMERLDNTSQIEAPFNVNNNVPVFRTNTISEDQPSKLTSESTTNDTTTSRQDIYDMDIIKAEIPDSPENAIESSLDATSNELAVSPASASVSKISTPTKMTSIPVSSMLDVVFSSQTDSGHSTMSKAMAALHAAKTSAACTSSDSLYSSKPAPSKATKSAEAQTSLEDLLDEIDVNLVLESAVRRCTPEKIFMQYKNKMRHVPQVDLERETIRMLGTESRPNCNETTLKFACRACGINKVLLRLPDIFASEKQFFVKLLNAYRQKIRTSDCMNILDFAEVKDAVCEKCTSSELAEMLSKKLKEEEQEGIRTPMTELSSLDAMLKRLPIDVIISHTVANDELIPSRLVLDIALQNHGPSDIAQALESQSPVVTKNVFYKLWSDQFAVDHINECNKSDESLLTIFKAVASKLSEKDLLQAFYECMNSKIKVKDDSK